MSPRWLVPSRVVLGRRNQLRLPLRHDQIRFSYTTFKRDDRWSAYHYGLSHYSFEVRQLLFLIAADSLKTIAFIELIFPSLEILRRIVFGWTGRGRWPDGVEADFGKGKKRLLPPGRGGKNREKHPCSFLIFIQSTPSETLLRAVERSWIYRNIIESFVTLLNLP